MVLSLIPVITEKSMSDAKLGKFTFKTDKEHNKFAIRKSVEDAFKVDVVGIATSIVKGKSRRVGKRRTPKIYTAWKKAIVELKKGQKIDLFDMGA